MFFVPFLLLYSGIPVTGHGGPRVLSTSACHPELHGKSESSINTLNLSSGKKDTVTFVLFFFFLIRLPFSDGSYTHSDSVTVGKQESK